MDHPTPIAATPSRDAATIFNRECQCIGVDVARLESALGEGLADPSLAAALRETHRNLFAPQPVFLARRHFETMRRLVAAVHETVATPGYQDAIAARTPHALVDTGVRGALLGFDFHLGLDGPQLIEINTNAGGVLLVAQLARAQRACCPEVEPLMRDGASLEATETALVEMFRSEWRGFAGRRDETGKLGRPLGSVALVDTSPTEQHLYPEFVLYRRLFERHGIAASIVAPEELAVVGDRLTAGSSPIDLVYNRMTDFYFDHPASATVARAWRERLAAVTPDPRAYALYADKRNLPLLTDPKLLHDWGVGATAIATLGATVPPARQVRAADADELWAMRRELFFKPATGHGSRGTYDGSGITRKTFAAVLESPYVAQKRVAPSQRVLAIDGKELALKVDLRCVVYDGDVLLVMARLYRGQTTNMRTEGGGLASVFGVA
ncbi:MAG TPA: hypothetical protein VNB06_20225 [Thermoanaerobaculia bacterium]|nr:hypothetical protein [Thermoanaerobaculia bacterium]